MYNAGYKTLEAIAKADVEKLSDDIEHLTLRLAKQLVSSAKVGPKHENTTYLNIKHVICRCCSSKRSKLYAKRSKTAWKYLKEKIPPQQNKQLQYSCVFILFDSTLSFFVQTWFKTERRHLFATLLYVAHLLEVDEDEKLAGRIGVYVLKAARLDVLDELAYVVEARLNLGNLQKTTFGKE